MHDDLVFIQNNPEISRLSDWQGIFIRTPRQDGIINPYYRPLLELLYRVQYRFFEFHAGAYHVFNVALHIFNSLLLLFLLKRIFYQFPELRAGKAGENGVCPRGPFPGCSPGLIAAWLLAVIFLIHPVQSESVACVSGISNILLVFLCSSSFILYLRAASGRATGTLWPVMWYVLSACSYLLALFTKEQAVVFPLLLLAYESTVPSREKKSRRSPYIFIGSLFLIMAAYFLFRKIVLGQMIQAFWVYDHEMFLRIKAIPRTLLIYMRILVFPWDLHYYRSLDILDPQKGAVALLLLCMAAVLFLGKKLPASLRSLYIWGCLWFGITLAPMLNFLPLIHEYSFIALFEHFLYWPMTGFFLSLFVVVFHVSQGRRWFSRTPSFRCLIPAVLILFLAVMTLGQNRYWRAEVPLFERAVKYEKNLARLRILLGKAYFMDGQISAAAGQFEQALGILAAYVKRVKEEEPRRLYLLFMKEAYFNLAQCYDKTGHLAYTVRYYQAALKIDPNDSMILNNLGTVFLRKSDLPAAENMFILAVQANPQDLMAKSNLALCYIMQGKEQQGGMLLQEVLSIAPDFPPARKNWDIFSQGLRQRGP